MAKKEKEPTAEVTFIVSRSALLKEINLLQGAVEKKNTIPILTNILIETTGSGIKLVATDLDLTLYSACKADVVGTGAVVLNAKKLFDVVRSLPDGDIKFSKVEDSVTIVSGSSKFKMLSLAKEHFPSTPQNGTEGCEIKSGVLRTLIEQTIFAITQEESRYALGGALLLLFPSRIEMVATDGHRLAIAESLIEKGRDEKVVIPRKTLGMLLQLTAASEESVMFAKDDNHTFFKFGDRLLVSRMLAGQFPNYDLVLPKNNDKSVKLNRADLAQCIRRVALMADERSHGIRLVFESGVLNLNSQTQDVGEAAESIQAEYVGETVEIGFNASYLLDFLNVLDCEAVIVELKDNMSSALLRPAANELSYRYVVMPMRVGGA